MDQGFWLFFIFQLIALGALSELMNLVGLRRQALLGGLAASLGAAFFVLALNYGGISSETPRNLFKWLMLAAMMGSLLATAASVALPVEISKKRA